MATWVQNMGLSKGSHLVEGSTLMPKWEDRSGICIAETKVNLLPKNLAQDPMYAKGPHFEIHGSETTFNLHPLLYEKVEECEYFQCLFVFKTFEAVVDVIYDKVTYVEPWAAGASRSPSSAFCLLLKLFHLRLTEIQVRALLDHGDSPYIRAIGALYVRYACKPARLFRWLGEYADDLEVFAPSLDPTKTVTFGQYCIQLMTDLQYHNTMLPRIPVPVERRIKVELVLHEEMVRRGASNGRRVGKPELEAGAAVRAIYRGDEDDAEPAWYEATIVSKVEPYEGAPEGTLPTYVVQFPEEALGGVKETVKLGQIELPKREGGDKERSRDKGRDRDKGRSDRERRGDRDRRSDRDRSRRDDDRDRRGDRDRSRRDDGHRDRRGYDGDRRDDRHKKDRHDDRDRSRRDRSRDRSRRERSRERSRRDRSRSRDRKPAEDKPKAAPANGESLLGGRDILGDIMRKEKDAAVASTKGEVHRRPVGYNNALIMPSDRFSYRQRSRSRSAERKDAIRVAPVLVHTKADEANQ